MAERLNHTDEGAARRPLTATLSRSVDKASKAGPSSPHSYKFRIATGLLVAVAVVALALAVSLIASGRGHTGATAWSSWTPTSHGRLGETEIAAHVAPLYRGSAPSDQLDVVTLMNIANANAAATAGSTGGGLNVAVNQGAGSSLSLLGGRTVAYDVCGVGGSGCQIGGKPSSYRLLLLRREALELALYTFRYIDGTDNVVVVLPPGHTQTTSTLSSKPPSPGKAPSGVQPVTIAVLFVRQELEPWLNQPLPDTLQEFPPVVSQLNLWKQTEEASLVDQITARGLFSEKIEQAQDGTNLLVLNQLPPQ